MKKSILCFFLILLTAGLAAFSAVKMWKSGENTVPVGLGIAEASDTVKQFCERLDDGDYEAVESMVNQYASLNLTSLPEESATSKLFVCLKDSMSCERLGECVTVGRNASQDISVRYFDMTLAREDVRGFAQTAYDKKLEEAKSNEELYDENGDLLESVAMEIYEEAVDLVIESHDKYMAEKTFTLELIYEDGRWQIVLTEGLVDILLGGTE